MKKSKIDYLATFVKDDIFNIITRTKLCVCVLWSDKRNFKMPSRNVYNVPHILTSVSWSLSDIHLSSGSSSTSWRFLFLQVVVLKSDKRKSRKSLVLCLPGQQVPAA